MRHADRATALIVADIPPMASVPAQILLKRGWLTAKAGLTQALTQAQAQRMDLVVVASSVAEAALEVATELRSHLGPTCPPIVLLSAHWRRLSPIDLILFDDIIGTPYEVEVLASRCQRIVEKHRSWALRVHGLPSHA